MVGFQTLSHLQKSTQSAYSLTEDHSHMGNSRIHKFFSCYPKAEFTVKYPGG